MTENESLQEPPDDNHPMEHITLPFDFLTPNPENSLIINGFTQDGFYNNKESHHISYDNSTTIYNTKFDDNQSTTFPSEHVQFEILEVGNHYNYTNKYPEEYIVPIEFTKTTQESFFYYMPDNLCQSLNNDNPILYKSPVKREERKYICDSEGCGKAFKRNVHLIRHKSIHLPKNERKRFQCTFSGCDKDYGTKYDLNAHIKKVHKGVPMYKCEIKGCGRRFVKKESFYKHMNDDHHYFIPSHFQGTQTPFFVN